MLMWTKVLTQFAMPLGVALMLILLGTLLVLLRRTGLGASAMLAGLLWVSLWSLPVVSDWLCGTQRRGIHRCRSRRCRRRT